MTGSLTLSLPTIKWPVSFGDMSKWMRSLSLDFVNNWGSVDCYFSSNYCTKTLFIMIAFLLFAVFVLPVSCARRR